MVKRHDIEKIKSKIIRFSKRLEKKGVKDAKYYVFGSWAEGRQGKYSDIDLAVVSDEFSGNSFEDSTRLRLLTIGIDTMLEPVAMKTEDFADKYNSLASEIKRTGIRVI